MAVFSNLDIKEAIKNNHIVCVPYNPKHVSHASLDITLGHYYYRIEKSKERTIYNPFDPEDVERYFDGPYRAIEHQVWAKQNGFRLLKNIPADKLVIPIKPGERILAHSHEFFGIRAPGACELKSRSSWARNGIAVCFDAGWIDPSYINRLTLEIFNLNQRETLVLPVGERIAQTVFHSTGQVDGEYGLGRDEKFSGKYQQGQDIEQLIKNWSPDLMLPKAYLDQRLNPPKIEGMSYD